MTNIFVISPKGYNIGNHAIHLGMQHFLRLAFKRTPNLISLPASSRYETHRRTGLQASTIYEINQYGDGVIIGGGNLYENGELDLDLDALEALEVPLMLFSLSAGRIYNRSGELVRRTDALPDSQVIALNNKSLLTLARDEHTLKYLHSLGISHAVLAGCPTLFLNELWDRFPSLPEADESGVLISIRNPALMNIPLPLQARVHGDISAILRTLRDIGHQHVRLLCHDHRDIAFAASFPETEYLYTDDIYTYLSLLNSCELNITYRLHSALPSLAFDKPFIKISYDERASSLMETIGLGDWNINMVKVPSTVDAVMDRRNRIQDLAAARENGKPRWLQLRETMLDSFKHFSAASSGSNG